jgi:uncharacterized protein GlcG (DUF336 family)
LEKRTIARQNTKSEKQSKGARNMKSAAKFTLGFALVGITLLLCGRAQAQDAAPAPAQGVVTQRSVSLTMAKTIAEAALKTCQAKGYHTSVAVVDRSGQVLVILRDEQATSQTVEMARRKAYTARMYNSTTLDFQQRSTDPKYAAQRDLTDILALGGGAPIRIGNEAIGGVASAGSTQEQDDACAKAGIASVADQLK